MSLHRNLIKALGASLVAGRGDTPRSPRDRRPQQQLLRSEMLRRRFAIVIPSVGIAITSAFLVLHLQDDAQWQIWLDVCVLAGLALILQIFRITGSILRAGLLSLFGLLVFLGFLARMGIMQGYLWMFIMPLIVFFLLGTRRGLFFNFLSYVLVAGLVVSNPPTMTQSYIELSILSSFGLIIGFAWMLEHLRSVQEEELRQLSAIDKLTGIANRRRFEEVLDDEILRAARYGTGLSLLVFDIDFFKAINDQRGHPVGDTALQQLASLVDEEIRESDTLARLGGDEFVVIAPGGAECAPDGARQLAERVRAAVAAHDFGEGLGLTISLGVADYEEGDDLSSLYTKADNSLYEAKQRGRNQVGMRVAAAA